MLLHFSNSNTCTCSMQSSSSSHCHHLHSSSLLGNSSKNRATSPRGSPTARYVCCCSALSHVKHAASRPLPTSTPGVYQCQSRHGWSGPAEGQASRVRVEQGQAGGSTCGVCCGSDFYVACVFVWAALPSPPLSQLNCPALSSCCMQDSAHFANEQRKQAQTDARIARLKAQAAQLSPAQLAAYQRWVN